MKEFQIKRNIIGVKISEDKYGLKIDEYKYEVETRWNHFGDFKEKEYLRDVSTSEAFYETKDSMYFDILKYLIEQNCLNININKSMYDLSDNNGKPIQILLNGGDISISLRTYNYNEWLLNQSIQVDDFVSYIQNFYRDNKQAEVEININWNFIYYKCIGFEGTNSIKNREIIKLHSLYDQNTNIYEHFKEDNKLVDYIPTLPGVTVNWVSKPKDIKAYINNTDTVIFNYKNRSTKITRTHSIIEYNSRGEFYCESKNKLYEYLGQSRNYDSRNTFTVAVDKSRKVVTIYLYELSKLDITEYKNRIENNFNDTEAINQYINDTFGFELENMVANANDYNYEDEKEDINCLFENLNTTKNTTNTINIRSTIDDFEVRRMHELLNHEQSSSTENYDKFNRDENDILTLGVYEPYWVYTKGNKHINPKFNNLTGGHILNVKNYINETSLKEAISVEYYSNKLIDALKGFNNLSNAVIAVVPSSKSNNFSEGLVRIAKAIEAKYKCKNITGCINRNQTIEKLSKGGKRDISVHTKSIEIKNIDDFICKRVILLDDVTTTGNSLIACKNLLYQEGALDVVCIALGKTVPKAVDTTFDIPAITFEKATDEFPTF